MTYDDWKTRSPDDERPFDDPCKWISLPDGDAYCRHCGARGLEVCKLYYGEERHLT